MARRPGPDDPLTTDHGLFAPIKPTDRLAEAFYGSDQLEQALAKLGAFMKAEEVEALRGILQRHHAHFDALLAEADAYRQVAEEVDRHLEASGLDAFAGRVAAFYGVSSLPDFTVVFVYWVGDALQARRRADPELFAQLGRACNDR